MRMLLFFILCLVFSNAKSAPYTGLKYTVKKSKLAEGQMTALANIMNGLTTKKWPNIKEEIIEGRYSTGFYLTNIKSSSSSYNRSNAISTSIDLNNGIVKFLQEGPALIVDVKFNFEVVLFGVHVFVVTGSNKISEKSMLIKEIFNGTSKEVVGEFEWSSSITVNGFSLFRYINKRIQRLFTLEGYKVLSKNLNEFLEEHKEDWVIPWKNPVINFDEGFSIHFNTIIERLELVKNEYISFLYMTELVVSNNIHKKRLYRHAYSDSNVVTGEIEICIAKSVLIGIVELQSKAVSPVLRLDPTRINLIGLTGKLRDFVSIMPQINNHYNTEESSYIECQLMIDSEIVRIKLGDHTGIQLAATCSFGVNTTLDKLFTIEFYGHGRIISNHAEEKNKFTMWGVINDTSVYFSRITFSKYPIQNSNEAYEIIRRILESFNNYTLLKPKLMIDTKLNVGVPVYNDYGENECFEFN